MMNGDSGGVVRNAEPQRESIIGRKARALVQELGASLKPVVASIDRLERDARAQASGKRVRCHRTRDEGLVAWNATARRAHFRGWLKQQKALLANWSEHAEYEFDDICASRDVIRCILRIRNSLSS